MKIPSPLRANSFSHAPTFALYGLPINKTESKLTKSKSSKTVEKNIYVEQRGDSFRLIIRVKNLNDSRTFSSLVEGLPWARRRRVELLEEAAALKSQVQAQLSQYQVNIEASSDAHLESIKVSSILESYLAHDVPNLSGHKVEASRVGRLMLWFGKLTIGDVDECAIANWRSKREKGILGPGRDPERMLDANGEFKSVVPSSQTIRHEMAVFRRAVKAYFRRNVGLKRTKGWLADHDLFSSELPQSASPRKRRLSDKEVSSIFNRLPSKLMKVAVAIALTTSLRRSEVVSLKWEDVDFERCVVRLRRPGHRHKKSKVVSRDVPLLPGAIEALRTLRVKEKGAIFPIVAGSLSQAWRRAADAAGIHDARLHDCRREAISRLVERGNLVLSNVVLFSGHSDIRVLQKHYMMPDPSVIALQLAVNPRMSNFIPKA